jgi:hypothetical protein
MKPLLGTDYPSGDHIAGHAFLFQLSTALSNHSLVPLNLFSGRHRDEAGLGLVYAVGADTVMDLCVFLVEVLADVMHVNAMTQVTGRGV